jgi:NAD(P)-dependent dehydrogenase (short-subunit alcohol dehydrogenase family)
MRLQDRVAVITGAGSGMGRAGALRFASEGAHVVVADMDVDRADQVTGEIRDAGGSAETFPVDVSLLDQLRALIDHVRDQHGVLHVLWNHAGVLGPDGFADDPVGWQAIVDVNLRAPYFATVYALDLLRNAAGKGSVIFTSSLSGLVGSPRSPAYSATKGGVVALTKCVALELAGSGVRANAICPGPVFSLMLREVFGGAPDSSMEELMQDELAQRVLAAVPLGRAAQPSEIAEVALFLASDASSFMTGVALPVDGGYVAR